MPEKRKEQEKICKKLTGEMAAEPVKEWAKERMDKLRSFECELFGHHQNGQVRDAETVRQNMQEMGDEIWQPTWGRIEAGEKDKRFESLDHKVQS